MALDSGRRQSVQVVDAKSGRTRHQRGHDHERRQRRTVRGQRTNDHLWEVLDVGGGQYKIKNINSALLLGINADSSSVGAAAVQSSDSGTTGQLWTLSAGGAAYVNPRVVAGNVAPVHDPSMIKSGGNCLLFATGGGIEQRQSTDGINFAPMNLVYAFAALPAWTTAYTNGTDLWAPDVSFSGGEYRLYFAASTFGQFELSHWLATTPTGAPGTWVDSGAPVVTSATCAGSNAIDPAFLIDASANWWLAFGSFFNGINMVQLDPNTGKTLGATPTCYSLAQRTGTAIEGSTVYLHDTMYYLFASVDVCCQGVNSTYHIVVVAPAILKDRMSIEAEFHTKAEARSCSPHTAISLVRVVKMCSKTPTVMYSSTTTMTATTKERLTLGVNLLGWTSDGWPFVNSYVRDSCST